MNKRLSIPFLSPNELSVKKPASNSLRVSLEQLTKNQLEIICQSYSEKPFSKKADLIDYLYSEILSSCVKFFFYENKASSELMLMFMEAVNESNGTVEAELNVPEDKNDEIGILAFLMNSSMTKSLMEHGFIFHHETKDDVFFTVPQEVYQKISKHISDGKENDFGKWEHLKDFAESMLSLYGVLTVRDFGKLWKVMFPQTKLSENELREHLSCSAVMIDNYNWSDNLNAIYDKYCDEDDVANLIIERNIHTMYLPAREQLKNWFEDSLNSDDTYFLNYSDQYEIEHDNPHYIQMRKFLEKHQKENWEKILYDMMYYMKDGFPPLSVFEILNDEFHITQSMKEKDVKKFFAIYQNLQSSTHLWINYGWSPNELEKHLQPQKENERTIICLPEGLSMMDFQEIPKVGRNDLCPCGSGKKYKQCHGK